MTVSFTLKRALKERGVSSKKLASELGVTPQTVSRIVSGKSKSISVNLIDAICRSLNCKVDDIMTYTDKNAQYH